MPNLERTGPKPVQLSSGDTFESTAGTLFHILPEILENCSAPHWTELLHILVIFNALAARRDEAGQGFLYQHCLDYVGEQMAKVMMEQVVPSFPPEKALEIIMSLTSMNR